MYEAEERGPRFASESEDESDEKSGEEESDRKSAIFSRPSVRPAAGVRVLSFKRFLSPSPSFPFCVHPHRQATNCIYVPPAHKYALYSRRRPFRTERSSISLNQFTIVKVVISIEHGEFQLAEARRIASFLRNEIPEYASIGRLTRRSIKEPKSHPEIQSVCETFV